jgi:Aspartyl protease/PDZ domain
MDETAIPFELHANKPRVGVTVNHSGLLDFLIDSGSVTDLIDTERAEELRLAVVGSEEVGGAGEATMTIGTAERASLRIGSIELPPQPITVAPIDARVGRYEGRRLDGLLGYDFFSRFPVELDYDASLLTVRPSSPRGEPVQMRLVRRHPFVQLKLTFGTATVEDVFVVDTGFRSAVVLAQPFVAQRGILANLEHTITATTGIGIGGPTVEVLGRADVVEIGSFALTDVLVASSQATAGTLADRGFGGIIGSELLRRFTATFDYGREELRLAPGAAFRESFDFDLSGLFLVADDGVRVHSVVEHSPAARAGIRKGDRILTSGSLEQLRLALRRRVGDEHALTVDREGQRFEARFELERLI